MYSRQYGDRELRFEASGGLINSSLVMQDKETDSYWAIMRGESIGGEFRGTRLRELPVSERMTWGEWKARHPDTLILSIQGSEYARDGYAGYWEDSDGFRGQQAEDTRLPTKEPIFAFVVDGQRYAIPQKSFEGGSVHELADGTRIFLYRAPGAEIFSGTYAFLGEFEQRDGAWLHSTGAAFDATSGSVANDAAEPLVGFDTFWYNWSLNNPDTEILR